MTNFEKEKIYKGFILIAFEKIIYRVASWTSVILGFYSLKDYPQTLYSDEYIRKSNNRVDTLNLVWWLIAILAYFIMVNTQGIISRLFLIVAIIRIINILSYSLLIIFSVTYRDNNTAVSRIILAQRSLLYAMINYIELIILFGAVYAKFSAKLSFQNAEPDQFSYLYFSYISQLTIGYGDIIPRGFIRFVASFQGMIGLFLIALTVGKLIGMIPMKDAITIEKKK